MFSRVNLPLTGPQHWQTPWHLYTRRHLHPPTCANRKGEQHAPLTRAGPLPPPTTLHPSSQTTQPLHLPQQLTTWPPTSDNQPTPTLINTAPRPGDPCNVPAPPEQTSPTLEGATNTCSSRLTIDRPSTTLNILWDDTNPGPPAPTALTNTAHLTRTSEQGDVVHAHLHECAQHTDSASTPTT
eukprot:2491713-Rhodomonas_salina.1